jgi:Uma2 family endonuclease
MSEFGGIFMAIQKKLYTVEEFEKFADSRENTDRRFELIEGEIVEKLPTEKHGTIAGNIFGFIWNFNREHQLGNVAIEVRHRMPDDRHNARMPDVSFISDPNRPIVEHGSVPHMPDLAIEVQSPDDKPDQMREKADYYLRNGSRLVWLFFTESKTVEARTISGNKIIVVTLEIDSTLDGGDVLPGFKVAVREIFPK